MKKIKSLSEDRIIIEGTVNGEPAKFLVDTGASVGMFDSNQKISFGLAKGRKYNGTIIGAGGRMKNVFHCDTFLHIREIIIPQFLLADIGNVVESIERDTGIKILGIISLPQMKMVGMGIDANDNLIILE